MNHCPSPAGLARAFLALGVIAITLVSSGSLFAQESQESPLDNPEVRKRIDELISPGDDGLEPVPLSLDQAIEIGVGYNLDIELQSVTTNRALEDIRNAFGAFDPIFTTSYTMDKVRRPTVDTLSGLGATTVILVNPSISQNFSFGIQGLLPTGTNYTLRGGGNRNDTPASGFFGFNPRNSTFVEATLSQPLLRNFGRDVNLADANIARRNRDRATLQQTVQVSDIVQQITDAYWSLYFTQSDVDVRRAALSEALELRKINGERVRAGTATRIDIYDADANIAEQVAGIIEAVNAVEDAEDTLLDLMNYQDVLREQGKAGGSVSLYTNLRVELTTDLVLQESAIDLEAANRLALDEREELYQADLDIERAEIELARRRRNLLPDLSLNGTWTQNGLEENIGNSIDELGSARFYDWNVGVNFEIPIGNRSARSSAAQAEFDLQTALITRKQLERTIKIEVQRAARAIRAAFQRVQTTQQQVQLRQQQLDGERQRLRVGTSTSFNVLQLQNDVLEAERDLIRAKVDYVNAETVFRRATGVIESGG